MLNTVDPIGQGELTYLEFYNYCYSSKAICVGALIIITMDPGSQNLQVTKLLSYLSGSKIIIMIDNNFQSQYSS